VSIEYLIWSVKEMYVSKTVDIACIKWLTKHCIPLINWKQISMLQ